MQRCVSFALDRIWGDVAREGSHAEGLLHLAAFCFYLPLGIMGPLINSDVFERGLAAGEHRKDTMGWPAWWGVLAAQSLRSPLRRLCFVGSAGRRR